MMLLLLIILTLILFWLSGFFIGIGFARWIMTDRIIKYIDVKEEDWIL